MNDQCVLCGKETPYNQDVSVAYREHYVEGTGQLCIGCDRKVRRGKDK